jgi:hypothetical protein
MSSSETRFLDEKLQTFGQFWAESKVNATLNAWALINNLRTFLPDAKRAGQSLVEVFRASLRGIPGMEARSSLHCRAIGGFGFSIGMRSVSERHQFLIYVCPYYILPIFDLGLISVYEKFGLTTVNSLT